MDEVTIPATSAADLSKIVDVLRIDIRTVPLALYQILPPFIVHASIYSTIPGIPLISLHRESFLLEPIQYHLLKDIRVYTP